MKTKAVRLYGVRDLRLEEFELPEIKEDEILVKVMSDSICMSTYKLVEQGKKHKRAPQNIDTNPVIVGHEFAGVIVKVGEKWIRGRSAPAAPIIPCGKVIWYPVGGSRGHSSLR